MEEELRRKIKATFWKFYGDSLPPDQFADAIFAHFQDAGYMSPELVKGLIFEVQAKKCASCPKNIIYAPVECQHEWGYYVGEDNPYKCIKCGMNKEAE